MPTAGTSQIMKCYESFEPYISNIFVKTTIAGEFIVINDHLVKDLIKLNLWSDDMRKLIIINNGSIQNINDIPEYIKNIYKTAFEIKLKSMIDLSAGRGPFVDQSQSMNLFMKTPDPTILTSAHFYAWKSGLKTGMYYLRGSPSVNPIQFGIDISDVMRLTGKTSVLDIIDGDFNTEKKSTNTNVKICKYTPGKKAEGCLMCSS
jgi:ribonucleotide reductase alpha subunit